MKKNDAGRIWSIAGLNREEGCGDLTHGRRPRRWWQHAGREARLHAGSGGVLVNAESGDRDLERGADEGVLD